MLMTASRLVTEIPGPSSSRNATWRDFHCRMLGVGISLGGTWEVPVRAVMEEAGERDIRKDELQFGASG